MKKINKTVPSMRESKTESNLLNNKHKNEIDSNKSNINQSMSNINKIIENYNKQFNKIIPSSTKYKSNCLLTQIENENDPREYENIITEASKIKLITNPPDLVGICGNPSLSVENENIKLQSDLVIEKSKVIKLNSILKSKKNEIDYLNRKCLEYKNQYDKKVKEFNDLVKQNKINSGHKYFNSFTHENIKNNEKIIDQKDYDKIYKEKNFNKSMVELFFEFFNKNLELINQTQIVSEGHLNQIFFDDKDFKKNKENVVFIINTLKALIEKFINDNKILFNELVKFKDMNINVSNDNENAIENDNENNSQNQDININQISQEEPNSVIKVEDNTNNSNIDLFMDENEINNNKIIQNTTTDSIGELPYENNDNNINNYNINGINYEKKDIKVSDSNDNKNFFDSNDNNNDYNGINNEYEESLNNLDNSPNIMNGKDYLEQIYYNINNYTNNNNIEGFRNNNQYGLNFPCNDNDYGNKINYYNKNNNNDNYYSKATNEFEEPIAQLRKKINSLEKHIKTKIDNNS